MPTTSKVSHFFNSFKNNCLFSETPEIAGKRNKVLSGCF